MSTTEDTLPFPRGTTALQNLGQTLTATDANHLEGREFEVLDWDMSTNPRTLRSYRKVRLRVVRNNSGAALPPKRLAVLARDAAKNISSATATAGVSGTTQVAGLARNNTVKGYPIDEWLPDAGVPDKDLFYIVVKGPAVVKTSVANYTSAIAAGDVLYSALTAATSAVTNGITTGGRVNEILDVASTDITAGQLVNRLGRALSANATNTTDSNLLVDVDAD